MKKIKDVLTKQELEQSAYDLLLAYKPIGISTKEAAKRMVKLVNEQTEAICREVIGEPEPYAEKYNQHQDLIRLARNVLRDEQLARLKQLIGE